MEHQAWEQAQKLRYYSVIQYRRICFALMVSFAVSIALMVLSIYFYLEWPSQRYFASNAEYAGSIIELSSMSASNSSEEALLKPDLAPEVHMKDLEGATEADS